MNARNYQKELEKLLLKAEWAKMEGCEAPRLFCIAAARPAVVMC